MSRTRRAVLYARCSTADQRPDICRDAQNENPAHGRAVAGFPGAIAASAVASTDLAPLVARARAYAEASTAENTRRAYAFDWTVFVRWCGGRYLKPENADDAGLAVYLATMADAGRAPKSIARAYTGIVQNLRALGSPAFPVERTRPVACAKVLRGILRTSTHTSLAKRPLLALDLEHLWPHLGEGLAGTRNRALVLLGFAGAFRRSELVGLDVADVDFTPEGMRVTVRRGKTDQTGKGQVKGIARAKGPRCPVLALRAWLEAVRRSGPSRRSMSIHASAVEKGEVNPLFLALTPRGELAAPRRRLGAAMVAHVIKRACAGADLPVSQFAGHSLRAGFATQAASQRKSLQAIMRQTGHKSVAQVLEYIRVADLFEENASTGILD